MKVWVKVLLGILLSFMCVFTSLGYAGFTSQMLIAGSANLTPAQYDIYISDVSVNSGQSVMHTNHFSTIFTSRVINSGKTIFTITVKNQSSKTYVYERVIDGAETGIDGVYTGTEIVYKVSNINQLDEVAPGETRSFQVEITVPAGVTTEQYVLKFNFVEKQGMEILPGNDEYDITFKYNNGTVDSTVKVHENEFVPKPETPVRAGYEFIGWYTDSACTNAWNFDIDRVSEDMTLYAGWKLQEAPPPSQKDYIVTFVPNNGDENNRVIASADSLLAPPTTPIMDGYTFIGWYMDADCKIPWNFDTDKVNSNMTLYGGWEIYVPPVPPACDITFVPNNGEASYTIVVMTGDFITRQEAPIYEGYVFSGWYTDESYTTAWNFEVNKVEGHMTLYGAWEEEEIIIVPDKFTVTFVANNGSGTTTAEVEEGMVIPRPEAPTREGYIFIGWYTDEACTMGWNFDIDKPTSDMTLYGGWEKEQAPSPDDEYHSDFLGLVEALLSNTNNCLNDNDLIFDSVMESLTSKKRPKEDAPILHCSVNSVSGGTMSAIASFANSKLSKNLHFIFEVDPDPAYQETRMRLYMYYGDECENANTGDRILVYKQIVTRGNDGIWFADGTYKGTAIVGNYFGGGNSGKDVETINPYSWQSEMTIAE